MFHEPFEELKFTGQLPSPSGVGMRVLVLTRRASCSLDDMVEAIRLDPALAGRIIKLATSVQSEGASGVCSVEEAAKRVELETVSNVALGFSLIAEERDGRCEAFDYQAYWEASAARAIAAGIVSRETGQGRPDEVSTAALLIRVGQLALVTLHPDEYASLLREKERTTADLARLEYHYFNVDHRQVTASLLTDWGLPRSHSLATLCFGRPYDEEETENEETRELLRLVEAADELARELLGGKGADQEQRSPRALAAIGLSGVRLEAVRESLQAAWDACSETLVSSTGRIPQIEELQRQAIDAMSEASAADPGVPQGKLRVLVVEDEPVTRRRITIQLEREGHLVANATNGRDALALALEWNPHIVVTDWVMPEMDGLELCKALRRFRSGRRAYVLVLTGNSEENEIIEAFEAGADDYVTKPYKEKLFMARFRGGERVVRLQQKVERDEKIQKLQVSKLSVLNRKLKAAAMTDSLTDLPNRRYAMKHLEEKWSDSERTGRPFSVIMIDVDHFKSVNDTYGHDVGDVVLQDTARAIASKLRRGDVCARMGGEEFLVICPNTDVEGATNAAERIRSVIEENRISTAGFDGRVTASLGVATLSAGVRSIDELIKLADQAVYAAKDAGRNRIVLGGSSRDGRRSA